MGLSHTAASQEAKLALGKHFGSAMNWYKQVRGINKLKEEDYPIMVDGWKKATARYNGDFSAKTVDEQVLDIIQLHNLSTIDPTAWADEQKRNFIRDYNGLFALHTKAMVPHKEQMFFYKASFDSFDFQTGSELHTIFCDTTHCETSTITWKAVTAEGGITRMLAQRGKSSMLVDLSKTVFGEEASQKLFQFKLRLFVEGFTDRATGKHYRWAFQNPSNARKGCFLFVEADKEDEIKELWLEITGFQTWNEFLQSDLFNEKGECVYAKLLTRVSVRGSNSFDLQKLAEKSGSKEIQDIYKAISKGYARYCFDPKQKIYRNYIKMVGPNKMKHFVGKEHPRELTVGDGQAHMSFTQCANICAVLRIITLDEYHEFCSLWEDVGKNYAKVKKGTRLWKLIQKMPPLFQFRHGAKKGTLVRYNFEAIPELTDVDFLIPDSVRKYKDKDWKDYPLEICNWSKSHGDYVALNPQFIGALDLPYDGLKPIADFWLDKMESSLNDPIRSMEFLKMVSSEATSEEEVNNDNIMSAGLVRQAIWANSNLFGERYIRNLMDAQYRKLITDMYSGRILVPGNYPYMISDPNYIINAVFHDPKYEAKRTQYKLPTMKNPVKEMKSGEHWFDGHKNGRTKMVALRSPLIHPFEVLLTNLRPDKLDENDENEPSYDQWHGLSIFNGHDGYWDTLGGADNDGDEHEAITDETPLGRLICNAVRHFDYDIYEPSYSAKADKFTFKAVYQYLAEHAKRDRVGIITNYAMRAIDLANSLYNLRRIAEANGALTIRFLHPKAFQKESQYGSWFGDNYPCVLDKEHKMLVVRGIALFKDGEFTDDKHPIYGDYTLDEVTAQAEYFMDLVAKLRPLQGREIDGAKTNVYAEGINGDEFVEDVKVVFTPHHMIARKTVQKRPISKESTQNVYHSYSALGFLCDYIVEQTGLGTPDEENKRILSQLKTGSNMGVQMYTYLTPEEQIWLNMTWGFADGSQKRLVDIMVERKTAYNRKLYSIMQRNLDQKEGELRLTDLKAQERAYLDELSKVLGGCPLTAIAVAAYNAANGKDSKQNSGLSYGWILPATNLEVFSRANQGFRLVRLPKKDISFAKVSDGILYLDGVKEMAVPDIRDGWVNLRIINGTPCAMLYKKQTIVTTGIKEVVDDKIYTINTYGFRYHIGKDPAVNSTDPDVCVAAWKQRIRDNNYCFDITEIKGGYIAIVVNGQSLSVLANNDANVQYIAPLFGKRVRLVNKANGPADQRMQWTPGTHTIKNLRVQIVGDAKRTNNVL